MHCFPLISDVLITIYFAVSEQEGLCIRYVPNIWHPLVPSVTNGLAKVRVGKNGLILNMSEIRSVSSPCVLYGYADYII